MRVILLLLALCSPAWPAQEDIPDGASPDHRYKLVFAQNDPVEPQAYDLEILNTETGQIIFSEGAGGFVSFDGANSPEQVKCLWSPSQKFVAVYKRGAKRDGDTSLYAPSPDSVQKVSLPDFAVLVQDEIPGELRAVYVRPELWLPNHHLALSVTGLSYADRGGGDFRFIAILKVTSVSHRWKATLLSFQRDETKRD
jgi:hypothetical protein